MSEQKNQVNILVTLDENYIPQLNVMLSTLLRFNPDCDFDLYLLHTSPRNQKICPKTTVLGHFSMQSAKVLLNSTIF